MMNNRYRSRSFALSQLSPQNKGMFMSVIFLGGIIITFLLAYAAFGDVQNHPPTLRLIVILHRHGDRTPTHSYANDPYNDEKTYWPLGWGQLTLKGKQQLYKLGKTLRNIYDTFVPAFLVSTVRVESSDVDRTLMSAGALLAGMFPPLSNQKWTDELSWQPIPVHSRPREQDNKIALKAPCPRYNLEKDKILKEIKNNETEMDKEFFKFLTEMTGQKVETVREVETIYSCLFIEELNNLKLPEWTKKVYPEPMKQKAELSMASHSWNTILKRLHGGPFVNEMLELFRNKSVGHLKDKKLFLYSGHDLTLITMWRTLGFTELFLPHYGASFIWELHQINDLHYVKMLMLNDTEQTTPSELVIPNCVQPCPLNMLFDITKPVRPVNWSSECQLQSTAIDYYRLLNSLVVRRPA